MDRIARLSLLGFALLATGLVACTADITPTASAGSGTGAGGAGPGSSTTTTGAGGGGGGGQGFGPPATQFVGAGALAKGGQYQMVFTVGQPSPNAAASKSSKYQVQGGLIGATQTLP